MTNRFLDEYKTEVINNILQASLQEEVQALITASLKVLEQNDIEAKLLNEFVDGISQQLHWFSPMNKDAQQWSNIATAKIILYRWKQTSPHTPSNSMKNV
jgi:hypothetical protein